MLQWLVCDQMLRSPWVGAALDRLVNEVLLTGGLILLGAVAVGALLVSLVVASFRSLAK